MVRAEKRLKSEVGGCLSCEGGSYVKVWNVTMGGNRAWSFRLCAKCMRLLREQTAR